MATQPTPKKSKGGPVWRQVDEILNVAGHRAPVEGEGENKDGNCCHLDWQFSNQNREDRGSNPTQLSYYASQHLQLWSEQEGEADHAGGREEKSKARYHLKVLG